MAILELDHRTATLIARSTRTAQVRSVSTADGPLAPDDLSEGFTCSTVSAPRPARGSTERRARPLG